MAQNRTTTERRCRFCPSCCRCLHNRQPRFLNGHLLRQTHLVLHGGGQQVVQRGCVAQLHLPVAGQLQRDAQRAAVCGRQGAPLPSGVGAGRHARLPPHRRAAARGACPGVHHLAGADVVASGHRGHGQQHQEAGCQCWAQHGCGGRGGGGSEEGVGWGRLGCRRRRRAQVGGTGPVRAAGSPPDTAQRRRAGRTGRKRRLAHKQLADGQHPRGPEGVPCPPGALIAHLGCVRTRWDWRQRQYALGAGRARVLAGEASHGVSRGACCRPPGVRDTANRP